MDDHTLTRIAQEWATFKRRLDSAYPETRGTEGYLGGLVESQRAVLDGLIETANNAIRARTIRQP